MICRGCLTSHRGHILDDLRHDDADFIARMQPNLVQASRSTQAGHLVLPPGADPARRYAPACVRFPDLQQRFEEQNDL